MNIKPHVDDLFIHTGWVLVEDSKPSVVLRVGARIFNYQNLKNTSLKVNKQEVNFHSN